MLKSNILFGLILCFSGCLISPDAIESKYQELNPSTVVEAESTVYDKTVVDKISKSLEKATKDQCVILYIQFKGLSSYLSHTNTVKNTPEMLSLFAEVGEAYGWKKESLSELSDSVESILQDKGFEVPHDLDDEWRNKSIQVFSDISEGCKIAAEGK